MAKKSPALKQKLTLKQMLFIHAVLLKLKKRAEAGQTYLCLHIGNVTTQLLVQGGGFSHEENADINAVHKAGNYVGSWIRKALGKSSSIESWASKRGLPRTPEVYKQIRVNMISHMISKIEKEIIRYPSV